MEAPNSDTPSISLLKAIQHFIIEDEPSRGTEEIAKDLRREGVDFEKLLKDVQRQAERAENRMRLKSFLSDVKDTACGPIERAAASIAELRKMVQDQIASLGTGASMTAFYRKLETAEEEDLLSLLDDLEELKRQADEDRSSGDK